MQQRVDLRDMAGLASAPAESPGGLLADEDVIGPMQRWIAGGQRAVLVTLVSVDGGAPRSPGAQMAVAEDGRFAGYLSGGCLEQAVALEALDVLAKNQNRLVRYGKGSPYIDIRLPCGSGLDLYFDQSITREQITSLAQLGARRVPAVLHTDLASGLSTVSTLNATSALPASGRTGDVFARIYAPQIRLLLVGSGPGLLGLASLAGSLGIGLCIFPTDEATRDGLDALGPDAATVFQTLPEAVSHLDFASAAVLVLHDHAREPEVLEAVLKSDCFYVGALGNHAVHRTRLAELAARGVSAADCGRIRAPVGGIPGAKSKATLAVGVLMELMAEAKTCNLAS
jgi:xanthine dehydrogenase accessory factor